jgi:crotonobetainyl-CoA:carnitine CoA-transferase CaiB-like acyl-CoA transferase
MTDAVRSFMLVEHGGAAICEPPRGPAGYNRILTPLPGQHTREVLAEAGLTGAEITAMERAGVLRAAERQRRT